jgi:tetratricopeptide (TPR) repeat protein
MKFLESSLALLAVALFAWTAKCQTQSLPEKAQRAKELMAAGKPDAAVPIYRELIRAIPNNAGLIFNLGLALDMSGNKQEAIRHYQAVVKLDPDFFPALLLIGAAYLDLGQPAKAIEPLERSVKIQPENFDAQVTLAEAEMALERFARAAPRFQKLAQRDPSNAKVWYGLGACYEGLAQKSFDALAETAHESAYWLDLVAESRLETKQTYSAFYFYRQTLAKTPSMRGVHAAVAEIYRETGHADWASTEEEKEKQLAAPDCVTEKLECEYRAGNFLGMVQDEARSPEALYWKTRAYNKLALDAYDRLGQLPASVETYELRARIESKRRQYAEAAKEWREALKFSPGSPMIKKELAMALSQSGNLPEAETLFREVLKQESESADLNYYLGEVILHAQKPQEAIAYLQKATTINPRFLPAQRSLGLAYLQTGQAEKAIPHLKEALSIDEDGSLHYQLGRAYQAQGERDLAREMLKQYQDMQRKEQQENKAVEQEVAITPPE